MEPTEYLFVDGGYLTRVVNRYAELIIGDSQLNEFRPIYSNLQEVARKYRKTYYYDCLPKKKSNMSQDEFDNAVRAKEEYFDYQRGLDGVRVIEGVLRGDKPVRQKRVDVAITVDMLTHAHRRNMTNVTFVTGDQDFLPLIEALDRDGINVTLWSDKKDTAREILLAANSQRPFEFESFWEVLPANIRGKFGKPSENNSQTMPIPAEATIAQGELVSNGFEVTVARDSERRFIIVKKAPDWVAGEMMRTNNLEVLVRTFEYRHGEVDWEIDPLHRTR
jgi:uncharacterized LabA/DUF88 family protein